MHHAKPQSKQHEPAEEDEEDDVEKSHRGKWLCSRFFTVMCMDRLDRFFARIAHKFFYKRFPVVRARGVGAGVAAVFVFNFTNNRFAGAFAYILASNHN